MFSVCIYETQYHVTVGTVGTVLACKFIVYYVGFTAGNKQKLEQLNSEIKKSANMVKAKLKSKCGFKLTQLVYCPCSSTYCMHVS